MKTRVPALLSLLFLALPAAGLAAYQAQHAKVAFLCTGPGGLRIEGTGSELVAAARGESLTITVPMAGITTGIGLRDSHMHGKYLESAKYPTAELVVPRAGLRFPADGGSVDATAPGTLTIHGQSKPVTFHYHAVRRAKVYEVQGEVRVDMRDYGIATPNYLGISVKPPVDVTVSFQLNEI
jgi:polyisoprenoid-binding protein YceI